MKIQPTEEEWGCLGSMERLHFKVVDSINRNPWMAGVFSVANATLSRLWVECFVRHTCQDHGFDNFRKIDPHRSVLLVANHRSLYDQFAIAGRLFTLYGNHHRIHFPVRAPFYYDSPLGLGMNMAMAFGAMYPPIVRDPKRKVWNRFATELMVELLRDPRHLVGFHPEGTRNQGPDPYTLLPGKPGCGILIHRARPNVVPVFLQGFPSSLWGWPLKNLGVFGPTRPEVHMVMGPPLDLSRELEMPAEPRTYLQISRKTMEALADLAVRERAIRAEWETSERVPIA